MNQSKQHKKTSEFDKDQALKKGQNEQVSESAIDLPGAVQRVTNDSTRRPGDILALQKTVGNRAVRQLVQTSEDVVQRSFRDDPEYREWRDRMIPVLRPMSASMEEVRIHHGSEGASLDNTVASNNAAHDIWNEATATSEGSATQESEASTEGGGGESQGTQAAEDIYEGGGGSRDRQSLSY